MLLVLILLISTPSPADEGFFSSQKLPENKTPLNLEKTLAAVIPVNNVVGKGRGNCSGSYISNDGYVVTALHCVSQCLSEQGLLINDKSYSPRYEIQETQKPWPSLVTCQFDFNGTLKSAKVVLVGKGRAVFDEDQLGDYSDNERQSFLEQSQDFAILKFEDLSVPCLQRSPITPAAGVTLWQIGFPTKSKRSAESNSLGGIKEISVGSVYKKYLENLELRERLQSWPQSSRDFLELYFSLPGILLTNVDSLPGSSGSGVVNASGQIVGIMTSVMLKNPRGQIDKYIEPLILNIGVEHIYSQVKSELGSVKAEEIFSCRDR